MNKIFQKLARKIFSKGALAVTFAVFAGCTVSGPFGTFSSLSILDRAMLWAPMVFFALVIGGLCCETVWRWTSQRDPVLRGITTALCFTVAYTPVVYLCAAFANSAEVKMQATPLEVVTFIFAFALILTLYIIFASGKAQAEPQPLPRLYARLPKIGSERISRMTVRDHYVHVCMDNGDEHRILMRFADAVNEMDGVPGFCTHRSHWVARNAAVRATRKGSKEILVLQCGDEVPVSKTYRQNVVAAGLL